jgi:hypothetical protein
MIGILRWKPFAEEVLARRVGDTRPARWASWATAVLPSRVRGSGAGELEEIDRRERLSDLSIETPPEHARQITAVRDSRFLGWRYFAGPDTERRVFAYHHASGRAALVTIRRERRGHRGQIRALTVLDYWGALPRDAIGDVARALARRFRDEADLIVFRGQPPGRQTALRRAGFVRRLLPRAIGVCIDPAGCLPTRDWYMVPADGDMSI